MAAATRRLPSQRIWTRLRAKGTYADKPRALPTWRPGKPRPARQAAIRGGLPGREG